MTLRIDPAALAPFAAAVAPVVPAAAEPAEAPAQFATLIDLLRSVFGVPAVALVLNGAPAAAPRGVWGAFLEVPLLRAGQPIGTLRLLDRAGRRFGDQDRAMLEGFARLAVEQVALWEQASRDALTGALTRRAFDDAMDRALAGCRRRDGVAALVLFDLDHFKRINDTRGHAAGDEVLRATARAVQRELRAEDSFGRVGGEEFAVLLAGADTAAALDVAERIRAAIARMSVPGQADLRVTASFGVVALDAAAPSAAALTEAADTALYAAKRGGRNRVEAAQPLPAAAARA
jgi:diguanylate cyclase (GGDEF)-like protein